MPIYEFFSADTNKIYSFYARSLSLSGATPRCPDGAGFSMERMMSSFAVTGRAQERAEGAGDLAGEDPRLEQMMAEMASDVGGLDEDHPDPRQLARLMRKMASLSGDQVPKEFSEMVRRMEAGEDPDKLEAEYGDALENFDPLGGKEGDGEGAGSAAKPRRSRPVRRDPTLYEMAEYVDASPGAGPREAKKRRRSR